MNVAVAGFEFTCGVMVALGLIGALRWIIQALPAHVRAATAFWRERRNRAWMRFPYKLRSALMDGEWIIIGDHGSVPSSSSDPFGQVVGRVPLPRKWTSSDIRSPLRDPHLLLPNDDKGTLAKFRPDDDVEVMSWDDSRSMKKVVIFSRKPKP